MGRLEYAKQTLPKLSSQPDSEVVFVDWSCPDNSGDWVIKNMNEVGVADVIQVRWKDNFNLSAARNAGSEVAHPGDVLCFIDCDIIVSEGFSKVIMENLKPGSFLTFQPRGLPTDGTCVVSYDNFVKAGKYDETYRSYGNEDADLYDALKFIGLKEESLSASLVTHISHPDEIKRGNYELKLTSSENQMYRRTKWELSRRMGRQLLPHEMERLYNLCISRAQIVPPREVVSKPANPKVSLCTTCKGREWQLRHVYKKDIEDNLSYGNVEFVLLNYDSPGDIDDYVKEELKQYIDSGVLKYYSLKTDGTSLPWNACVAKNMAHRLATGDILCNLDGDNLTGPNFAHFLAKTLPTPGLGLRLTGRDAGGRIAMWKEDFLALGGYDESFLYTGGEDNDLEDRAWLAGIKIVIAKCIPNGILPNTDADREKYLPRRYVELVWENEARRRSNKQLGRIGVNELGFAPGTFVKNFGEEVHLGTEPTTIPYLSDINSLYKIEDPSRPIDGPPDGVYYVVHKDWRDPLFLKPDGEFYKAHGDNGKWKMSAGKLFILWDAWAPEVLGGHRMRSIRIGNWEKDDNEPRLLLPPEKWEEIFRPWENKRVAYLGMYGNVGDQMIYDSALQMMSHYKITYQRWSEACEVDALFMSGGGNLGAENQVERRAKLFAWAKKRNVPCVILPQTLIEGKSEDFPGDVTIYARELVTSKKLNAKFSPDLALGFRTSFVLPKPIFERGVFGERMSSELTCDPIKLCQTPEGYVAMASLFNEVVTNRLHFAIASLIAGRKTVLLPNEYHKNRSVWEASLRDLGCGWRDQISDAEIPGDGAAILAKFMK